jgi:hypothetical protein
MNYGERYTENGVERRNGGVISKLQSDISLEKLRKAQRKLSA